uniref:DUF19 domain-containing protein n=1 Tax=Panagrellus redivivus TaxID=6233 RepID=A0A7E4UVB9_PANRE
MKSSIGLLLITATVLGLVCQACDQGRFHYCYSQYLSNLKIDFTPAFPVYSKVKSEIDELLWALRWHGQIKLCNFQHTLIRCIGPDAQSCLDTSQYESALGIRPSDAFQYKSDYLVRKFECTEGLPALANSFDCLVEADSAAPEGSAFNKCMSSQVHIIQTALPNCTVANDIIDCTIDYYTHHCGKALKQFACNVAKIRIQAITDQCDLVLKKC